MVKVYAYDAVRHVVRDIVTLLRTIRNENGDVARQIALVLS